MHKNKILYGFFHKDRKFPAGNEKQRAATLGCSPLFRKCASSFTSHSSYRSVLRSGS